MRFFFSNKAVIQIAKRKKSSKMTSQPDTPGFKTIVEGRAIVRSPCDKVFYNPVQEFNRDLSIAVLTVFVEDFKKYRISEANKRRNKMKKENLKANFINMYDKNDKVEIKLLDALSATGLRSIRYAKEIVDVTKIIANDICEDAVETMKNNIIFNNVDHIVETCHEDACLLMYKHRLRADRFAAVDLDPYGCASIFLDAAVQSVADGGMLLVTATDMAVMAGNSPESCYAKYGSISVRTKCCHEMGLRILLQCIETQANKHSRYIVPMLSISADFYIRVFVKVYSGAIHCKQTSSKVSMVYHCVGCDNITLQPLGAYKPNPTAKNPDQLKAYLPTVPPVGPYCDNCNQKHQMGGPIWSAAIHDESFVSRVLSLVQNNPRHFGTAKRLEGVLSVVREELSDAPLYYTLARLCGTMHVETIPILIFRSALLNAGYKVSYSHANKMSIKTNAPQKFIWDIMRTWAKQRPIKSDRVKANPILKHILSQPITHEVDLTERMDANPDSRKAKHTRFQNNPTPHWGPGCRSTMNDGDFMQLKAMKNQNKNKLRMMEYQKKRRLSMVEGDGSCKDLNKKQLLIDTTSEPDSEASSESSEYATDIRSGERDADTGECDADMTDEKRDASVSTHNPKVDIGTDTSTSECKT